MDKQVAQIIDLATRTVYSVSMAPRLPGLSKLDIIRSLVLSVYNRGMAEALACAAGDELSTEEILNRAVLLGEISLSETRTVEAKIAEALR